MGKIFNINNPFWTFMGKLVDVVVLHFVWLVCCLPVVTIGPSTTALYYSLLKDTRDEGAHYVKDFFKSFKQNLKQGIILGLIMLVFGALLSFSIRFYLSLEATNLAITVVKALAILVAILYLMILQYVFALLARFDNTVKRTIQNAFVFSIRYIGWTIVMIIILAAYIFVILWYIFIPLMIPGYALVVFLDCYILNHIFKPYVKEQEKDEEDPDAWSVDESEYVLAESSYTPIFGNRDEDMDSQQDKNAADADVTAENALETAEDTAAEEKFDE